MSWFNEKEGDCQRGDGFHSTINRLLGCAIRYPATGRHQVRCQSRILSWPLLAKWARRDAGETKLLPAVYVGTPDQD